MENWDKIAAVKKMQEYIEKRLKEPITLSALSMTCGYSPWHSARIFKDVTGKPPFEYIRQLRLSHAAIELRNSGGRVVDTAFDFVFGSHEGFTRAFSKHFGIPPKSFQKSPVRVFLPLSVRDLTLTHKKGDTGMSEKKSTVFVQVVDRPARKLILKRGIKAGDYYEYCGEVGCDVWDKLAGIRDGLYEPIGMWLPENMRLPGTSEYAQGVEMAADYAGPVPGGFELIGLPPCKMMVFQGPPFDDEKFEDAIGDLWEVMDSYEPEIYGFRWADEDGPRFQLAPMGYRGYIEARPVRTLQTRE